MRPDLARVLAIALLTLALADCSTRPVPTAGNKIPNGTVLVVRTVQLEQMQQHLLYAIGAHQRTGTQPLVEVIVRKDNGGTVALIQPPQGSVRPGARVVVDETEAISPAATPSSCPGLSRAPTSSCREQ